MKMSFTILKAFCLIGLLCISVFAQEDMGRVAVERISQRYSIPAENLVLENEARVSFPMQRSEVLTYKVTNTRTGEIYPIAFNDSATEVDVEKMQTAEQDAYIANYGRVEPELSRFVETVDPAYMIEVTFWIKPLGEVSLKRPAADSKLSEEEIDNVFARLEVQRSEIAREATERFVSQLREMGIEAEADGSSASVDALVPVGRIKELSFSDEVEAVYLQRKYANDLVTARPTIGADIVHNTGNTGQGVRVAQVEVGGLINTGNPFLAGIAQDTTYGCFNNHGTNVAGVIRSTHPTVRGIAPGVQLWAGGSCGGNTNQLKNRTNAAAGWGARTFNLSFGSDPGLSLGSFDRFYDDIVQNGWRTIVASAGNNNPPYGSGTGNVGSPGLAYNIITVGAFNHRSDTNWGNDTVSNFSSWRDPSSSHGDREKPEVSAPGGEGGPFGCGGVFDIQTTSNNNLGTNCGTSFSAPMVTATSALLMNTNSSLSVWPEAVKSIIMATAVHNIEGAARLSEFDGAGGIVADRANRVAGHSTGTWGAQGYSCGAANQTIVSNYYVNQSQRVRVVMAWDTNPSFWNFHYGSRPSADLDMQILGPDGNVVASSASWDNTYEIVDFNAPKTGTYRLRVNKYRCSLTPKWLGWAWHAV